MTTLRTRRVADVLRALVAERLARDVGDPRLAAVHVTRVTVSPDLRQATVFWSLLPGHDEERELSARALERARGFLRREIGRRVRLRVTPELHFRPDRSSAYAAHIDDVLGTIRAEDEARGGPPGGASDDGEE